MHLDLQKRLGWTCYSCVNSSFRGMPCKLNNWRQYVVFGHCIMSTHKYVAVHKIGIVVFPRLFIMQITHYLKCRAQIITAYILRTVTNIHALCENMWNSYMSSSLTAQDQLD